MIKLTILDKVKIKIYKHLIIYNIIYKKYNFKVTNLYLDYFFKMILVIIFFSKKT